MISRRHRHSVRATLALAIAAAVATASGAARAEGPDMSKLAQQGWACASPHFGRTVCFNPGQGYPLGDPTPNTAYNVLTFDITTGEFRGTGHWIRADLYQGQQCGPDGAPYSYLPLLKYYQCFHD